MGGVYCEEDRAIRAWGTKEEKGTSAFYDLAQSNSFLSQSFCNYMCSNTLSMLALAYSYLYLQHAPTCVSSKSGSLGTYTGTIS